MILLTEASSLIKTSRRPNRGEFIQSHHGCPLSNVGGTYKQTIPFMFPCTFIFLFFFFSRRSKKQNGKNPKKQREFPLIVDTYHELRAEGLPFSEQYQSDRPPVLDPGGGSLLDRPTASSNLPGSKSAGGSHSRSGSSAGTVATVAAVGGGGGRTGGGDRGGASAAPAATSAAFNPAEMEEFSGVYLGFGSDVTNGGKGQVFFLTFLSFEFCNP